MSFSAIGDQARAYSLRLHHAQRKADLDRLTQELASGKHTDAGRALKGEFSALTSVERSLSVSAAYRAAASEAALFTSTAQSSLETFQTHLGGIATDLLSAVAIGSQSQMSILADAAPDRLQAMIQSVNHKVAGRALFSGAATDQTPLIPVSDLMTELETIATAAPDTATLIADVNSWFMDAGGGYETIAYRGANQPAPGFTVAQGEVISNPASALNPGLRKALMGMALTTLVAQGAGPPAPEDRAQVLHHAALMMVEADAEVTDLRARLGDSEARIAVAQSRNEANRASMELERGRLIGIDPYDAATALEETRVRLESLYVITTRLSRLSLTEFMR